MPRVTPQLTRHTIAMTEQHNTLQHRLDFAVDAARDAGELMLRYFRRDDLAVELKEDRSPVTAADRESEQLLRDRITQTFSGDGVLGEELDDIPSTSGYRWILDPIDGTKSFVHGVPLFGTLIGMEHEGRVVLGVCRLPALDEVVYAADGHGAWWQVGNEAPRPAQVSSVDRLADALFCVTTVTGWAKIGRQDVFDRFCRATRLTRGWGDCYGHMLVATGRAELIIDPEMSPWDAAAHVPILQEAGGHFVDWQGRAAIDSNNGLSVNNALKDEVLELLNAG